MKLKNVMAVGAMLCLGVGDSFGQAPGSLLWKFTTGGEIISSPAVAADGTIYVGSSDEYLYALNPDGTLQWRFETHGAVPSSPAIGPDGTIYVGSGDERLYAINPDGTKRWEFRTRQDITGSPAIGADGTIYIGSYDNMLYAVLPHGQQLWSFDTGDDIQSSPTIGTDGTIYVGSGTNFFAVDIDGNRKWVFPGAGLFISSAAIGTNGMIYVGCRDNRIYALNTSGTKQWEYKTRDDIQASPTLGADETVYIGSFDNGFYALYYPPHANTNGVLKRKLTVGNDIYSSAAIAADGTIYVGCYDWKLYAFNPDGTTNWTFTAEDIIRSSPAIGPDGTVYVGSSDQNLYAIKGSSALATNGWPMFRHDLVHSARVGNEETGAGPVIDAIADQSVVEGNNLSLVVTATNQLVGDHLIYSLEQGAPSGATIGAATGVFSWTPTEAQGPGTYTVVVRATSARVSSLYDRRQFTITVQEDSTAPVLANIDNRVIVAGLPVVFTAQATDVDFPANDLTFRLVGNVVADASIDRNTGLFTWTTQTSDAGATRTFTVEVSDNGSPSLSDQKTFTVQVVAVLTTSITREVSGITLTWTTTPGKSCRIQYRDDLTQGDWQDLGEAAQATERTMIKSIPLDSRRQRFYRIVEDP